MADKNQGGVESVLALVLYFAREGYWHHVQTVADQVIKKRGRAPVLSFWKAYAVAREGEFAAAIREFDDLRTKREVEYPAILALLWAHERTDLTDHDAINELSSAQRKSESRATPEALLLSATFKWLTGDHPEARRIVQLVLDKEDMNDSSRPASTPISIRALTLRGWIDLTCAGTMATNSSGSKHASEVTPEARDYASRSIRYFDRALGDRSSSKRDLEAMMGRAKFYEHTGKFTESLESLNQAIVLYQWFHPALSEKAKVLVRMGDWDQAYDTAERVIQRDRQDIEAIRIMSLHALLRSSSASNGDGEHGTSTQRVVKLIGRLTESLERHEPMNAALYFECSRPLARLASRRPEILRMTLDLVKRAQKLRPAESSYVTEYAYQSMLMGNLQRANDMYKQAASLDDANVDAVTGMIRCQLEGGQLVDAEQQIEFMREIQSSIGESSELMLLTALLAWRKDGNRNKAVQLLDSTLETFWRSQPNATSSTTGQSWSLENIHTRFVHCNLDFLLQISREYLQHSGTEPLGPSEQSPPHLTKGESTLCTVVSLAPGFIEAQFLLAQARYLGRKLEASERTLNDCLRLDPTFSKAHMLMAQLHLKQDRPNDATKSLEQAKALDFEIRENPQFHLIQGRVADASGDTDGAIKILEGALKLPAMQAKRKGGGSGVTPGDRATLYICLTELYAKSDQLQRAMSLVKKAMKIFRGSPEEVRVLISSSELAVQSGQTKRGLALLQSVRSDSPAFSKAQETMANVYLTKLHDKRKFIQCYEKLLSNNRKSPSSHVSLGDAWMRIQEPDKAIAAYEDALAQNPNDAGLPLIIGRALVKTHDYHRAIQYYEDAVRRTRPSSRALAGLQLDLAELYRKLKKYDQAGRVMDDALEERRRRVAAEAGQKDGGGSSKRSVGDVAEFDVDRSKDDVKCLLLVSRIKSDERNLSGASTSLTEAKALQTEIVQRVRGNMDESRSQRHQAAEICCALATHYQKHGSGGGSTSKDELALSNYQEALRHEESHEMSLISLAKMHLRSGDLDKCRQYCMTLTRIDSNNEEATMMLADMMFQKREFQPAIFHFQQLLQQRPDNFKGLYKLLQLLRRAGKIQEAQSFLDAAEKHSPQTKHRPGFQFCKGMYARYTNEVAEAIRALNQARKSAEWGEESILNMVEVYLNPDNENIWEGMDGDGAGNANEGNMEAVRICERLLREIKRRPKSLRHEMLECHALIGTRQRPNIELALSRFVATLKIDSECVPALRGMSMALLMLKQTPKARNCLRRIHKMKYDPTFAEDYEVSCNLLLIRRRCCSLCLFHLLFNNSFAQQSDYIFIFNFFFFPSHSISPRRVG